MRSGTWKADLERFARWWRQRAKDKPRLRGMRGPLRERLAKTLCAKPHGEAPQESGTLRCARAGRWARVPPSRELREHSPARLLRLEWAFLTTEEIAGKRGVAKAVREFS